MPFQLKAYHIPKTLIPPAKYYFISIVDEKIKNKIKIPDDS
jgi:hypothetical protein